MADKKQAAAELLKQYQIIKKLEAQFPTLQQMSLKMPYAPLVIQIMQIVEAKLAKQETAQVALTAAAPEPEPNDDINQDEFKQAFKRWASNQTGRLLALIETKGNFNTILLSSYLSSINSAKTDYNIILDLAKLLSDDLTAKNMSFSDVIIAFNKTITSVSSKSEDEFKAFYKEDKKAYKKIKLVATFDTDLKTLDPATWLEGAVAKIKSESINQEDFISHSGFLVLDIMNKLSAHKTDSFTVKTADILSAWTILFSKDSEKIFSPLEDCIKQLDTLILITDFYDALEKCSQVHFSKEALLKIPAEKYTKCKYVIELSKNGQTFYEATIRYKYDWSNIFADWLKKWQSESEKSINSQDTSVKEILVEPTALQLLGKSAFLKTKVPMLAYIADEWLKKFPKTATANTVEILNGLSEIIKTVCSLDSSQTPLKEQLEVFKAGKGDIPNIDTLLNCLARFNITAEPYCNTIQNWIGRTNGCAAAVEFEMFMVERLNTNLPILFADKIDEVTPIQFISDTFKKHLATIANGKSKISKDELATIWDNTLKDLKQNVLISQFNILQGELKNDSLRIYNLIEDLNLYLPAKESINFAFEQSAFRNPIKYVAPTNIQVPSPNTTSDAKTGSTILVNMNLKELKTMKGIIPVSISAQIELSNIKLEYIETKLSSSVTVKGAKYEFRDLKFAKISSAKATLKSIQCMGAEITNTALELSLGEITMPKNDYDAVRGDMFFNIQLKTPSYTLQNYTAATTNNAQAWAGFGLSTAGGAVTAYTGFAMAAATASNPIGWGIGAAALLGAILSSWGGSVSSEAKGEPSQSTTVVPGTQLDIQVKMPYFCYYLSENDHLQDRDLNLEICSHGEVQPFLNPVLKDAEKNIEVSYSSERLFLLSAPMY